MAFGNSINGPTRVRVTFWDFHKVPVLRMRKAIWMINLMKALPPVSLGWR